MIIKYCKCKSEFQDKQYGVGKRLHTSSKKHGDKCTVCGQRKLT